MSSGRSSQVWACFSVERTKYLMFSKSIPERSAPQVGMGFLRNIERPLRRFFSIHSGSLFSAEMFSTTSSLRPRRAVAPAASESDQPNSYCPRFDSSGRSMSTSDMVSFFLPPTTVGMWATFPRTAQLQVARGVLMRPLSGLLAQPKLGLNKTGPERTGTGPLPRSMVPWSKSDLRHCLTFVTIDSLAWAAFIEPLDSTGDAEK